MAYILTRGGRDPLFTYGKMVMVVPYLPPVKMIFVSDIQCFWTHKELIDQTAVLWPDPEQEQND